LKKRCEARRHEAFAERGNHAAGDENIPRHGNRALIVRGGKTSAKGANPEMNPQLRGGCIAHSSARPSEARRGGLTSC
jgi:hypothetical protein